MPQSVAAYAAERDLMAADRARRGSAIYEILNLVFVDDVKTTAEAKNGKDLVWLARTRH